MAKTTKVIRLFLASSSELVADRKEFEIFINRQNKEYIDKGIFLELVLWEDFLDAMSQTRLQDEYNKAIASCDIFVSLFHTKVGKYTEEEFLKALETFKANNKPLIYTYFKDSAINVSEITSNILSLLNFKQKLSDLGHFYTSYADINDLKYKFSVQLTKLNELPQLLKAAAEEGTRIIPIILKPCRFSRDDTLAIYQAANSPTKPLAKLSEVEQEEIYDKVSELVEALILKRE